MTTKLDALIWGREDMIQELSSLQQQYPHAPCFFPNNIGRIKLYYRPGRGCATHLEIDIYDNRIVVEIDTKYCRRIPHKLYDTFKDLECSRSTTKPNTRFIVREYEGENYIKFLANLIESGCFDHYNPDVSSDNNAGIFYQYSIYKFYSETDRFLSPSEQDSFNLSVDAVPVYNERLNIYRQVLVKHLLNNTTTPVEIRKKLRDQIYREKLRLIQSMIENHTFVLHGGGTTIESIGKRTSHAARKIYNKIEQLLNDNSLVDINNFKNVVKTTLAEKKVATHSIFFDLGCRDQSTVALYEAISKETNDICNEYDSLTMENAELLINESEIFNESQLATIVMGFLHEPQSIESNRFYGTKISLEKRIKRFDDEISQLRSAQDPARRPSDYLSNGEEGEVVEEKSQEAWERTQKNKRRFNGHEFFDNSHQSSGEELEEPSFGQSIV